LTQYPLGQVQLHKQVGAPGAQPTPHWTMTVGIGVGVVSEITVAVGVAVAPVSCDAGQSISPRA
jgi:hypothetical protein